MTLKPWDITPELKEDYICVVSRMIKDVRHEAIALHDPDKGDGNWSLECRIYERTINVISRKAEKCPWLSFYRENLYFVILINGIPIRFYKGSVDKPSVRTLRRKYPERENNQLFFDFESEVGKWAWRISVDTESNGTVFNISIAQYDNEGHYRNIWNVPLDKSISVISSVEHIERDAVVLGKPIIHKKSEKTAKVNKYASDKE